MVSAPQRQRGPAAHIRPRASARLSGSSGQPADGSLLRAEECVESASLATALRREDVPSAPGLAAVQPRGRRAGAGPPRAPSEPRPGRASRASAAASPLGGALGREAAARPHLPGAALREPRRKRRRGGCRGGACAGPRASALSETPESCGRAEPWRLLALGPVAAPARMALSKGLRLLGRLDASGDSSVLLEARGRRDCLLFEAGTVATLGECLRSRRGPGAGAAAPLSCPGARTPRGEGACLAEA